MPDAAPLSVEPVVCARGVGVRGRHGWIFANLEVELPPGGLAVVTGPAGSGRSTLLLCLTGRLLPDAGDLRVAGFVVPTEAAAARRRTAGFVPPADAAAARRRTAVARMADEVGPEPTLTVAQSVAERAAIDGLARPAATQRYDTAAKLVGLDVPARSPVEDLPPLDRARLALALALLADVDLIALDDVETGLGPDEQEQLWAVLRAVADTGTAVLAATLDPRPPHPDVLVTLPTEESE